MSTPDKSWQKAILPIDATVKDAIQSLNLSSCQIVLIVTLDQVFVGTITDGDIRRGLLKGLAIESPLYSLIHRNAMVVPAEMPRDIVMQLMVANKIQQIPVVDQRQHVIGLHLWDEINAPFERENLMVIMAGGVGTRLRPQTEHCPKPLLPVAGKPILEHIIERAKAEGISHFVIAIHYLGHMIEDYFGSGDHWEVRIEYVREQSPLGTAGALSLISPTPTSPFLVTNGDVLTDIRYAEMLDFHVRHDASATMAVRMHEWQHPFGVVQTNGIDIIGIEEKPIARTYINAGVYVLNPCLLDEIPDNTKYDMPALFAHIQDNGKRAIAYPMHEPWLDIGRPDDLVRANAEQEIN